MSLRRTLELLKTGERANDLLYCSTIDDAWSPVRRPPRRRLAGRLAERVIPVVRRESPAT